MYHSFEELEVWKRGCRLAVHVYETLKDTRELGLRDQMQRAAVSIPSNIAEGAERGGKDCRRDSSGSLGDRPPSSAHNFTSPGGSASWPTSRSHHLISETRQISKMLTDLAHGWTSGGLKPQPTTAETASERPHDELDRRDIATDAGAGAGAVDRADDRRHPAARNALWTCSPSSHRLSSRSRPRRRGCRPRRSRA